MHAEPPRSFGRRMIRRSLTPRKRRKRIERAKAAHTPQDVLSRLKFPPQRFGILLAHWWQNLVNLVSFSFSSQGVPGPRPAPSRWITRRGEAAMCIVERRTGHPVEHDRCLLLQLRFLGHPLLRGLRINMLPAKSGLDLRLVSGPHRARAALNQDPGRLFTHDSRAKNHAHPDAINPERKYFRAGAESRLPDLRAYGEIAVRPRLIGELRSNVDVVKIVSNRRPPFPQLPILLFCFPFSC